MIAMPISNVAVFALCITFVMASSHMPYNDNFLLVSVLDTDYQTSRIVQMHLDYLNSTQIVIPFVEGFPEYDPTTMSIVQSTREGLKETKLYQLTETRLIDEGDSSGFFGIDSEAGLLFSDALQLHMISSDGLFKKAILPKEGSHSLAFTVERLYKQLYFVKHNSIVRSDYDSENEQVFHEMSLAQNTYVSYSTVDYTEKLFLWLEITYGSNYENTIDLYGKSLDSVASDPSILLASNLDCSDIVSTSKMYACISYQKSELHVYNKNDMSNFTVALDHPELVNQMALQGMVAYESLSYNKGTPTKFPCANTTCSHYCVPKNSTDSYTCECPKFFKLSDTDNSTCNNMFHHHGNENARPALVYSGITAPHPLEVGPGYSKGPIIVGITGEPDDYLYHGFTTRWDLYNVKENASEFTKLDVSSEQNAGFFFEKNTRHLVEVQFNHNLVRSVHGGASNQVNGLAYDWVHHNLYWTDAAFNAIKMKNLQPNGQVEDDEPTIVVSDGLELPYGIAVDPAEGLLYVVEGGEKPALLSFSTDGSDRKTLLEFVTYDTPQSLNLDSNKKLLYFTMRNQVFQFNLATKVKTLMMESVNNEFLSVAHYDDLVMSLVHSHYNKEQSIQFTNTHTKESRTLKLKEVNTFGLAMNSFLNQPHYESPCLTNNTCSHACTALREHGEMVKRCLCPDGKVLTSPHSDQCVTPAAAGRELGYAAAIVYVLDDQLCKIDADKASLDVNSYSADVSAVCVKVVADGAVGSVKAVTYDVMGQKVYVAVSGGGGQTNNGTSDTVYTVQLEGDITLETLTSIAGDVRGLALDYVDDVLYWTDASTNELVYKEANSTTSNTLLSNLVNPEALVFDAKNRRLTYAESTVDTVTLSVYDFTSGTTEVVYHETNTIGNVVISSIKIDYRNDELYWVEKGDEESVIKRTYESTFSADVVKTGSGITGVDVLEDFVVYADEKALHMYDYETDTELLTSGKPHPQTSLKAGDVLAVYIGNQPGNKEKESNQPLWSQL